MSLRDNINTDIRDVFMNLNEFAEDHVWDGIPVRCIIDRDADLKRKSNITHDIMWDNNKSTMRVFMGDDQLPNRPVTNTEVLLDGGSWRVLASDEEMGIWIIVLVQNSSQYF